MLHFQEQINRIKSKLERAKKTDKKLKVFGASTHKYRIGKVVSENDINNFETKYNIKLPLCYKSFISQIGNGGISYDKSAAGPFYGIYPLSKNVCELVETPEKYLSQKPKIYPGMKDEFWKDLTQNIESDIDMTDEEFDIELGRIFSGILPIGSQGCTYLHGIITNGEHKGKVVNLDLSRQKPKFTYENNFLDWYERWLDEIISGELLENNPSWFGYSKRTESKVYFEKKKWYEIWKK